VKTKEEKHEFYDTVSSILNIDHDYHDPARRRTRWNARNLGNGRYPGFGLVQCFGSSVRVMSKHGTKIFYSYEDTYKYLKEVVDIY
jgi:hypothetical protein